MAKFKVALVGYDAPNVPDWVGETIEKEGMEFVHRQCVGREELAETAHDADIVWVLGSCKCMQKGNLAVLDRCGAIVRTGSGTDNIPVAEATEKGIVVANTPEAISTQVADHTVGLLMAVIRHIPIHDRLVREGVWDRMRGWPQWHLTDQTFGLVGFGHIAQLVARRMRGFEVKLAACDPFVGEEKMAEMDVRKLDLDELLEQSDFVSIHCPLNDKTRHLIGERELRLMKPSAVLVNTARGPVVDEPALIKALREGWISAAGLDVLEKEAADLDNPIFKLENTVITPHIAPYSDIYFPNFWKYSVETVIDLYHRRWPRSYVNKDVKPRWELS